MAAPDDTPLRDLAAATEHGDPDVARALSAGGPRRPPEYRRGRAWALLAVALVALVAGFLLPQGLLLAAGLVVAGAATGQLASAEHRTRRRDRAHGRGEGHGQGPVRRFGR